MLAAIAGIRSSPFQLSQIANTRNGNEKSTGNDENRSLRMPWWTIGGLTNHFADKVKTKAEIQTRWEYQYYIQIYLGLIAVLYLGISISKSSIVANINPDCSNRLMTIPQQIRDLPML